MGSVSHLGICTFSQTLKQLEASMILFLFVLGCNRFKEQSDIGNFASDHVITVDITIDNDDWDALRNQTRTFFSEFTGDCMSEPFYSPYIYYSADITIDDESHSNVGIRKKGFLGSQSTDKPSLKINVDEYVAGQNLYGVDNITLNNSVQDPSLIRQCIGYQLFANAGYPSPQCNFAHVFVNGTDLGIYVHVEPIKRMFLRTHFDEDDGDLYEGTVSDFAPIIYRTFEPKNENTDTSLEPIFSLKDALEDTSDLESVLQNHIDVDAFLTFWALESILNHWDGYAGNRNNYYVYHSRSTDKFTFIPWGLDDVFDPTSMEEEDEPYIFSSGTLANYILSDAGLTEQLNNKIQLLMDTVWNEERILAEIDRMESLLSSETVMSERTSYIDEIRYFVEERRSYMNVAPMPEHGPNIPPYCIQEVGSIEASFETQWGTLEDENPTTVGSVDIEMIWDDTLIEFDQIGSIVGPSDAGPDRDVLLLFGQIGTDYPAYIFPYVDYVREDAKSGMDIEIDSLHTWANVLYTDSSLNYTPIQAAMIHSGTIKFEEYDDTDEGNVRGYLSTSIYNWREVLE